MPPTSCALFYVARWSVTCFPAACWPVQLADLEDEWRTARWSESLQKAKVYFHGAIATLEELPQQVLELAEGSIK